jgi:hypothetical protein
MGLSLTVRILLDQVARHGRGGGGIADHDEVVADDDARVRVPFGGVGPAVGAELLEGDLLVFQVGLGCKCFGHGGNLLMGVKCEWA